MDNLSVYNQVRVVPKEALKEIQAGRLKGKSDINPMWRIKALTEQFGICGIGWKYAITKQWLENGGNNEISAFVNIDLHIKVDGAWSDPIPGTGGSAFVANERNGLYTSDECFKMALTDAISVACKALGFGADVYWNGDATKYNKQQQQPAKQTEAPRTQPNAPQAQPQAQQPKPQPPKTAARELPVNWPAFWAGCADMGYSEDDVHFIAKESSISHYNREQVTALYKRLQERKVAEKTAATAEPMFEGDPGQVGA